MEACGDQRSRQAWYPNLRQSQGVCERLITQTARCARESARGRAPLLSIGPYGPLRGPNTSPGTGEGREQQFRPGTLGCTVTASGYALTTGAQAS